MSDYKDFEPKYTYTPADTEKPFRFWCQKVLPAVYDDSLSYYELLAKVIDYLNKTMENVNLLGTDVDELEKTYKQLVEWVNAFKEYGVNRLDSQDEEIVKLENSIDDFFKNTTAQLEAMEKALQAGLESIDGKVKNALNAYTVSSEFDAKVESSVNESLGGASIVVDVEEINNKIGISVDENTVFSDLESIKNSVNNINIDGVNDINTKIGNTTDIGGSDSGGSVMAKLNTLIKAGSGGGGEVSEAQLQSVVDNIGGTSDTVGTALVGTIFGKLNNLINTCGTTVAGTLSNIQTSLNNLKNSTDNTNTNVNSINTDIGETTDADGTANTGTIFGKLNALLTSWTATRAGYIDSINTNTSRITSARAVKIDNIGSTGDTGGSATGGTVMGKLNTLLNKSNNSSFLVKNVEVNQYPNTRDTLIEYKSGTLNQAFIYIYARYYSCKLTVGTKLFTVNADSGVSFFVPAGTYLKIEGAKGDETDYTITLIVSEFE